MMGASKRIMELYLMGWSERIAVSTARFANVAFSDGSLLHGFSLRIGKRQPLSAPHDVRRYFITPQESGELCLMSCLLGENRDILFPKLDDRLHLITFADIARRYLHRLGYEAHECDSEEEARALVDHCAKAGKWPCYFFRSDTTGEKELEEFTTAGDRLDMRRFKSIGVIQNECGSTDNRLDRFGAEIARMRLSGKWTKAELVTLFCETISEFDHNELNKNLDGRM
jgi:FlaA1/EpsC-like NDP-sugar epimerase